MRQPLIELLLKILAIDSTTGTEACLADYLAENLHPPGASAELTPIAPGQKNLLLRWGQPKILFCTHLDTVPPYFPPFEQNGIIYGRGSCDAKGQIAAMYEACCQLHQEQQSGFGLLLVAGEETDSIGAKAANQQLSGIKFVIVGEPTENRLISAAKGILKFDLAITGTAAHSGYPTAGDSATAKLPEFFKLLANLALPEDPLLGPTTYNLGKLFAPNPANVLADLVQAELLFRTTFTTHQLIPPQLARLVNSAFQLQLRYQSQPINFFTVDGFTPGVVAFGSDAASLNRLGMPLLYGPGTILDAHSAHEQLKIADLWLAVQDLKRLYYQLVTLL